MARTKVKTDFYKKLGDFLAESRVNAGLSQKDVSDKLGYSSPQFVSNFERGTCMPPMNKLKVLADLYDINPKELADLILKNQRVLIYHELKIKNA